MGKLTRCFKNITTNVSVVFIFFIKRVRNLIDNKENIIEEVDEIKVTYRSHGNAGEGFLAFVSMVTLLKIWHPVFLD